MQSLRGLVLYAVPATKGKSWGDQTEKKQREWGGVYLKWAG